VFDKLQLPAKYFAYLGRRREGKGKREGEKGKEEGKGKREGKGRMKDRRKK
jgi:hypothetical protein